MSELRSNDWEHLCIMDCQKHKKHSREFELSLLENSEGLKDMLGGDEFRTMVKREREYRALIDEDIGEYRERIRNRG